MAAVASARQELPHLSSAMDTSTDDHPPRPASAANVTKPLPSTKPAPPPESSTSSTSASTTSGTTATSSSTAAHSAPSLNPDNVPPPPPPAQETPGGDYFSFSSRFDQEPNPFEQSFLVGSSNTSGVGDPLATPKAILPPVNSITSPAPLLPGSSGGFWGPNSLRSGPLSPAMLQGPAVNPALPTGTLFDSHIRTGLTPNESGIRSGLTPGGSGSMFPPAPSPASQLFNQFVAPSVSTPGTMEFKKTALSAATKKAAISGANDTKIELPEIGGLPDPTKLRRPSDINSLHDPAQNAAANGLYLLAQAQTQQQQQQQQPPQPQVPEIQYGNPNSFMPPQSLAPSSLLTDTSPMKRSLISNPPGVPGSAPDMRNGRGNSMMSEDESDSGGSEGGGRSAKGRNTRRGANTASRRKADESSRNGSSRSKKARTQDSGSGGDEDEHNEDRGSNANGDKNKKMTDEEKRRNFLERNRVAALKCRQRKKQWLASLQKKVELYTSENDALNQQVASLREELVALKTLLIAHKDCPGIPINVDAITGLGNMPLEYVSHSYPLGGAGVMAPPGTTSRRFS